MPKQAVFTMKLEPELRDAFMAAAAAADRPASQIVREMMRDYVQKLSEERDYNEFERRKVEKAIRSVEAGRTRSREEANAGFDRWRAERIRAKSSDAA